MPATKMARNKTQSRKTKPSRGVTEFPGSCAFADEADYDRTHVWRVLKGKRQSKTVVSKFAKWLKKRGMVWPKSAAVRPAA